MFEPERHEPLVDTPWSEARGRAAIVAIARDAHAAMLPDQTWPPHPLDLDGAPSPPLRALYMGAAGTILALHELGEAGAIARTAWDVERLVADYDRAPDRPPGRSYFLGEVGVLWVAWRLAPSAALADRLYIAIEANIAHPANEPLWAAPGTMLAAIALWERTGEERWRELYRRNAAHLRALWTREGAAYVWTQELYGHRVQLLGAAHGFAGNAFALLRGLDLLDREDIVARVAATLAATAAERDGLANWPQGVGPPRPGRSALLLQWCHGAPGVITSLARCPPHPDVDRLLLAGGELTWRAGPLAKGPGLCHGTAGNGFALLALYQRTGDPRWLARARAFAMHAIAQVDAARAEWGHGRPALFLGDAGVARFLWGCITADARFPALDA